METDAHYTIIGAFVVSMIAAIAFGIIWLSSGFSLTKHSIYRVYMEDSVSGLNIDSPVEYNGVNVGVVKSIQLDKDNPHLVDLLLSIKSDTPITEGTVATLSTRGITGITFISLKDSSDDLRRLTKQKGQPYPIIKAGPSLFTRLDTALSNLSENMQKVSVAFEGVFDKENQEALKVTFNSLAKLTETFANNSQKLNTLLENASRASRNLEPLLQSTASTMSVLQNQTLPATYRLLNNINDAARTLAEISAEVKQNPSILVRGVSQQTLGPGEKP